MKKSLLVVILLLGATTFADNIGYIDSASILRQYNKAIAAQTELQKKQKEFQAVLVEKQQQLEQAKTEGKTDEELVQVKEELEKELQPKREELLKLNQELSSEVEAKILAATKDISKQLRIDVVLDKQVVLSGGMDLTSLVLSKLNNSEN